MARFCHRHHTGIHLCHIRGNKRRPRPCGTDHVAECQQRYSGPAMSQPGTPMPSTVKTEAEQLVRDLPEQASWDDLMYEIHVRQKIEQGVRAADAGRVVQHEEVRRRFAIGQ